MSVIDVLSIFKRNKALLVGHFLLSSGKHSQHYLQCAKVLENPQLSAKLCRELAKKFRGKKIDAVIGPALGGITLAYELARALGARALFAERVKGVMSLRRGFTLSAGERVLIAEDVITTGGSVKEVIKAIKPFGVKLVGVGALIDRSGQSSIFGKVPLKSLKKIKVQAYTPAKCPLCKSDIPAVKPGSREKA